MCHTLDRDAWPKSPQTIITVFVMFMTHFFCLTAESVTNTNKHGHMGHVHEANTDEGSYERYCAVKVTIWSAGVS